MRTQYLVLQLDNLLQVVRGGPHGHMDMDVGLGIELSPTIRTNMGANPSAKMYDHDFSRIKSRCIVIPE
jgi:hypothetical protein